MNSSLKIVFMGTPDFSCAFLKSLIVSEHQVVAVATQPDRPAGRGRVLTPPPVKSMALELNIPVFQPEDLKDPEWLNALLALEPDVFVVVAYSILPKEVLAIPRLGSVNIHTSLLPKYRGAAPVQHALLHGESQVGMSLFYLDEKMDHGPIVAQWSTKVGADETYLDIMNRFQEYGPQFLLDSLQKLQTSTERIEQDHSQACGAPKLKKEDGLLDFNKSAQVLHNQIRALCAWPVAYAFLNQKPIKIYQSSSQFKDFGEAPIGTLGSPDQKTLWVKCADLWMEILRIQPEGRKEVTGGEFWRGLQQKEGLCLTSQA